MVTFAEASDACRAAWGDPSISYRAAWGDPSISYRNPRTPEHPAYAVVRWEMARGTEVELHEEAPGVAAPLDIYIVARCPYDPWDGASEEWALHGTRSPTDEDPLTPLPDAIAAAGQWMRDRGVEMPTAEFDNVLRACRAAWGPPESDAVVEHGSRIVKWPRAAGDPSKGGVCLCEFDGHAWINASPDWSPENEDYDRARAWSVVGEPFDADDAPVVSVGDAIFAAGRFLREHGGPMPMPDPYDPEDMPSRGYDR